MPPKVTVEAPAKLVPVSVTIVPAPAPVGVNAVMVGGGGMTVKFIALVAAPPGVVTLMGPLLEPACTLAVMVVAFTGVKTEEVPLNFTVDTLTKLLPVMVTTV